MFSMDLEKAEEPEIKLPISPASLKKQESSRKTSAAAAAAGVGCHSLLQCMKVKSEREVAQSCPTLSDPVDCCLPGPWDFPGKSTGVGCHCLLQCMKVKNEREVAQSCPTLCDPMDCSLPGSMDCSLLGSSAHGIFQAKVLEWKQCKS